MVMSVLAKGWNRFEDKGILVILIVICLILTIVAPNFAQTSNILNILKQISEICVTGVGLTLVIICAEIDLSVGSLYGLCMMVAALILQTTQSSITAVILAIGTGMGVGLVNGLLVTKVRVPAFIATLSMLYILRGCIYVVTDGTPISQFPNTNIWFFNLGVSIGGVFPVQIIVMAVFVVGIALLLKKGTLGFKFFAVGGNQKAAHLAGINVDKVKIAAFVITGFCCAWAAIIALAYMKSVHPTIGGGREMDVIAAVIIGGTNLYGGRGSATGTLIGAAIMGVMRNGMVMLGVQAFYQTAFIGVVILVAVVADIWLKRSGQALRRLKTS